MDSEERMWERLFQLLAQDDWEQTVYIYRVGPTGRKITPYIAKWGVHSYLLDSIRDEFGSGLYHLMIRDGKTMVFTGTIGLECPIQR